MATNANVRFVPKADLYHARLNKNLNEYPRLRWLCLDPCFFDARGTMEGLDVSGAELSASSRASSAASISCFDNACDPGWLFVSKKLDSTHPVFFDAASMISTHSDWRETT